MRSDKGPIFLTLAAIVIQWLVMAGSDLYQSELPFSTGLLTADMIGGNVTIILYAIIPIPFILWQFSGNITSVIDGYGKLYIIRNYSKLKMILKEIWKMILSIIGLSIIIWCIFHFLRSQGWIGLPMETHIKIMAMYALSLIVTVMLQYLLEFFLHQSIAQLVTLIYFATSLFIYAFIENSSLLPWIRWTIFPNLAFAMRNGVLETEGSGVLIISLVELLAIGTMFLAISLKMIKRKDIL